MKSVAVGPRSRAIFSVAQSCAESSDSHQHTVAEREGRTGQKRGRAVPPLVVGLADGGFFPDHVKGPVRYEAREIIRAI